MHIGKRAAIMLLCSLVTDALAQSSSLNMQAVIDELGIEESALPVRELPFWRRPEKVYIVPRGNAAEREQQMREAKAVVGDIELIETRNPVPADVIADAEVLLARCTPDIIRNGHKLKWLQHSSHGIEQCIIPEALDRPLLVTNVQHTSGPPIADHVIAMMTMLTRGLHHFQRLQDQQIWSRRSFDFPVIELTNKTMLVVGLGGIGTEVARRAHGLGMRVVGVRNSSREGPDYVDHVGLSDEVYKLAADADVIVNALPLTSKTRGLFDEKFFNAAKHGAFFISVGRGESTVTADLIAALKDGRLAAAGLDVTDPEPLPPGHELWELPNVIITPHMSSATDQGRWRRWAITLENLRRYVNGEKMLNVVDLTRGY